MTKPTREERRLRKEQERQLKAETKAAARAEREAAKRARKLAREGQDAPEEATPMWDATPFVPAPRLELVTEPGPVKHIHWDPDPAQASVLQAPAPTPAPAPTLPAAPEPLPEAPPSELPQLLGRRRTLYTTDHGNKVVAYERDGQRRLAITEERDGRLEEVPFDEAQVDRVIGATPEPAPTVEEPQPEAEAPKRGFWRRRKEAKAAAAASTQPVAEHVFRPVEPVATLVTETVKAAPAATPAAQEVAAWEPGAALRQVMRPDRPATARPAARAVAKPARARRARKPLRVYPGDNHPVIDVEGIGPTFAKKLEAMGITTTGLLNAAQPGRIANRLQVPRSTVRKWQAQAELLKVPGIGPQFAEALARSGVTGIDELKRRKPAELAGQVAKYLATLDQTVVGTTVSAKRIAAWKRKAAPMRRVPADRKALAIPNHGIPPPWLREEGKGRSRKAAKGAAGRKAARRGTQAR